MNEVIEVKVEDVEKEKTFNIYQVRNLKAKMTSNLKNKSEVTVIVLAYNNLEKTRRCIDSVLKYTKDVDYDLVLIDNGSQAKMLEYFKSIDFAKKTIIHVDNNIGAAFPYQCLSLNMLSEYVVTLANDIIVTPNWLSNMLEVFKTDETIGLVNPVSSNVSNLQCVDLEYDTYEEMQEQAKKFNVLNPKKWQERLRIITLATVYRKACLYAIGWPMGDVGFIHDFVDDDIAFRVRRMGYKVILAGDTWVCHDHSISEKDPVELQKSLEQGRADFQQKYYGVDAWDDVNNYIFHKLGHCIKKGTADNAKILGIDVKCGMPILDIKNVIRSFGIYDAELSAFTQDEKYVEDLKTVCNGIVACDHEAFMSRKLPFDYYDYIMIDKPINAYHEPMSVLMDAFMLLKKGGQLLFSLKNTNNIVALLDILGVKLKKKDEYCYNYTIDALAKDLRDLNISFSIIGNEPITNLNESLCNSAKAIVASHCEAALQKEQQNRLMADKYWISIEK